MEFSWTDDEQQRYSQVVEFARGSLNDDLVRRDHEQEFSRSAWKSAADFGVLGWALPPEVGGCAHPLLTVAYFMEALGYGCHDNGLSFGLGTQMWGVQTALSRFANDEQSRRYLPRLATGESIGAFAVNEPSSGSDAFGIETTAVSDGDGYVINGEKVLVTFAPVADFAIVFAKTRPDAGRWGISAFVIDADTPGYRAHPAEAWMGLRTVPAGRITLEDCRVPRHCLLSQEGAGASIFGYTQGWERSLILAPQVGAMQRLLETCVEVARSRKRAGVAIGKHQAVSHRIADMRLRLETARLLLYKTAWLQQRGERNLMEAALAKIHLSECFTQSSLDAIAVHGGEGYQTDAAVERNLRDAIGATIYSGTVDVQRNIVAGLLGL